MRQCVYSARYNRSADENVFLVDLFMLILSMSDSTYFIVMFLAGG